LPGIQVHCDFEKSGTKDSPWTATGTTLALSATRSSVPWPRAPRCRRLLRELRLLRRSGDAEAAGHGIRTVHRAGLKSRDHGATRRATRLRCRDAWACEAAARVIEGQLSRSSELAFRLDMSLLTSPEALPPTCIGEAALDGICPELHPLFGWRCRTSRGVRSQSSARGYLAAGDPAHPWRCTPHCVPHA